MTKVRAVTRALAGLTVAATATAVMASPASAHPEITTLACDVGAGLVECIVLHTGTASPFTIRWAVNNRPIPQADDSPIMRTTCSLNSLVTIRVTITDPHGTDSDNITRRCGPVIP